MIPCVIVIRNNVVDENIQCEDAAHAERVFLDKLRTNLSNWDEYTPDDIQAILDEGFEKLGIGSVCLSWAMTPEEIEGK